MNKARRNALAKALPLIVQVQALIKEARDAVECVRDDEKEVYDNLSEGQQNGDMGDAMQRALDDMDEALDGFDGIDLKTIVEALEKVCDDSVDVDGAVLGKAEAEERRMARLPHWVKERIAHAEKRADDADARLGDVFPEWDEKKVKAITIDDYSSPVRGRVIPSDQVAFPAHKLRVSANRHGGGIDVDGLDMGTICILPRASNGVTIRLSRDF